MTLDVNLLRIAVTVVSFVVFIGILAWAGSSRNRARFEAAARIPLDEDETLSPTLSQGRGSEGGTRFREGQA